MKKTSEITIGIDLGDKKHAICVLDGTGEIIEERAMTNNRDCLRRLSKKYPGAGMVMVMEVGSHSSWTSRYGSINNGEFASSGIAGHRGMWRL